MSIAHGFWPNIKSRPIDLIEDEIYREDISFVEDVGEKVVDEVRDVAASAVNSLLSFIEKFILPVTEIGLVIGLGVIIIENI